MQKKVKRSRIKHDSLCHFFGSEIFSKLVGVVCQLNPFLTYIILLFKEKKETFTFKHKIKKKNKAN
jgi:hypothetical protein